MYLCIPVRDTSPPEQVMLVFLTACISLEFDIGNLTEIFLSPVNNNLIHSVSSGVLSPVFDTITLVLCVYVCMRVCVCVRECVSPILQCTICL